MSIRLRALLLQCSGMHTKNQPQRVSVCVCDFSPSGQKVPRVCYYQRLVDGLSTGYSQQKVSPLTASFSIYSIPLVMKVPPQYSRYCRREMGLYICVPHNWGKQAIIHCFPSSPPRLPTGKVTAAG